jgi:hypothetical protein
MTHRGAQVDLAPSPGPHSLPEKTSSGSRWWPPSKTYLHGDGCERLYGESGVLDYHRRAVWWRWWVIYFSLVNQEPKSYEDGDGKDAHVAESIQLLESYHPTIPNTTNQVNFRRFYALDSRVRWSR